MTGEVGGLPDATNRGQRKHVRRGGGATFLALCLAVGISAGLYQPHPWVWPWLMTAIVLCAAAAVALRNRPIVACIGVGLATIAFGAAWVTIKQEYVAENDLVRMIGDDIELVRVRGEATRAPAVRDRVAGSMSLFNFRPPATYFPMRVDALVARDGEEMPVQGNVYVRVNQIVAPFSAGDKVEAMGRLMPVRPPSNPGQFDFSSYAKSLGQAGILFVDQRGLLNVQPREHSTVLDTIIRRRDQLQARATGWMLADLSPTEDHQREALLTALLLGDRGPALDNIGAAFRRIGLAHLLAISGLHLGVLVGLALTVMRLISGHLRPRHGWILIGLVVFYLLLVELRLPVLRAGVMTIAGSLGLAMGRRWRVSGLVAASAIGLLLWRPTQLFSPGFQLSFGVVLGLIHLSPILHERWFGQWDHLADSSAKMIGQWFAGSFAAAVTAWAIATPIVAYHFDMISPLAALLSVAALPLVALLLAIGYVKMALGALLPSGSLLIGVPLAVLTDLLLSVVETIDVMPGSVIHVPHPSPWWAVAGVVVIVWWILHGSPEQRRVLIAASAAMVLWLFWPAMPWTSHPPLRVDMLAVGDGSCIVVRSDRATIICDAGSSTDLNAGNQTIVPAMRRLGVRRADALVITHANLDHYSAALEIVDEFSVDEVLVTRDFLDQARAEPIGPVGHLVTKFNRHRVRMTPVCRGHSRMLGEAELTILHPAPDADYEVVNDYSLVMRIEVAGRELMLCGDIQEDAMADLIEREDQLNADILELPHHGSHNPHAERFVAELNPTVVMQSTAWRRWQRDRWHTALHGVQRLVTARDGACWVEVSADGTLTTGQFNPPPSMSERTVAHRVTESPEDSQR